MQALSGDRMTVVIGRTVVDTDGSECSMIIRIEIRTTRTHIHTSHGGIVSIPIRTHLHTSIGRVIQEGRNLNRALIHTSLGVRLGNL